MSIFIKGLDPPENCRKCYISSCPVCQYAEPETPDECPIIEVPTPHGNLIDEDEVYNNLFHVSLKSLDRTIVIEAEPGREKLSTLLNK